MRILYFDCRSGISGNMALGALLEILGEGAEEYLRGELAKLRLDGYRMDIRRTSSHDIGGTYVDVTVEGVDEYGNVNHIDKDEHHQRHDHEQAENHEHEHDHSHDHAFEHEQGHDHPQEHNHDGGHSHSHRCLGDINELIDGSGISDNARSMAKAVFLTLAEAEAKVHNRSIDEVHFHEVGATDSIVDIVGTCILLDRISPDRICSSVVCEGSGFITCAHGKLSVPVPATLEIFTARGVRFRQTDIQTELVTPTGAAILGTLADSYGNIPEMIIQSNGYGLGSRETGAANVLRVYLGETAEADDDGDRGEKIIVIESNIDDSTGEELGYALEKLMEAGARDAFFTPIFMKKNRPAYMLSVICTEKMRDRMTGIIFRETSSIGVRYHRVGRTEAARCFTAVETPYGTVTGKQITVDSGAVYTYPEYEDMKKLAEQEAVPLREVRYAFREAVEAITDAAQRK